MSFFTLTLVRHGQTTANKEGILQGQSNTQLSDIGRRQAQLVSHRLQNDYFSHIFSSDLDRAAETAQVIKEGNKTSTCAIVLDKRLREREESFTDDSRKENERDGQLPEKTRPTQDCCYVRTRTITFLFTTDIKPHFGSWQGRPGKEFRDVLKNAKEDWKPPGGGERADQVQLRAASFFEDLCHQMRQCRPRDDPHSMEQPSAPVSFTGIPEAVFTMDTSPQHGGQREDDVPSIDSAVSLGEGPDSPFLHETDLKTIRTVSPNDGSCPNVSLSPLVEQRYTRFSSVSSGRNSFEDTDYLPANVEDVLVVSHGGWIRELFRVFINKYSCRMSGGNRHALLISPNTGVSRFVVTLPEDTTLPRVTSVFIHDRSHLDAEYKTALDL